MFSKIRVNHSLASRSKRETLDLARRIREDKITQADKFSLTYCGGIYCLEEKLLYFLALARDIFFLKELYMNPKFQGHGLTGPS